MRRRRGDFLGGGRRSLGCPAPLSAERMTWTSSVRRPRRELPLSGGPGARVAGPRAGSRAAAPAFTRVHVGRPVAVALAAVRHWGSGASPWRPAARSPGPGHRCCGTSCRSRWTPISPGASRPAWSSATSCKVFAGAPRASIALPLAVAPAAMGGLGGALFLAAGASPGLRSPLSGVFGRSCEGGCSPASEGPCVRSGWAGVPVGAVSCCTPGGEDWGSWAGGASPGRPCRLWADAR